MELAWLGSLFDMVGNTTIGVTKAIQDGKTARVQLEQDGETARVQLEWAGKTGINNTSEGGKTNRTLIIAACVVLAIVMFGLFVYSNRRK